MKHRLYPLVTIFITLSLFIVLSCRNKIKAPSKEEINSINLKRGEITLCSASNKQLGHVEFETSCIAEVKEDFNLAIELLHSFEYDEAEKAFAKVIDKQPDCAMAYWGVAMCNNHPLWSPPNEIELKKGAKAINIARLITGKTDKETDYIEALTLFYKDWNKINHHTRSIIYEKAMEKLYHNYPQDKEAGVFYALAIDASTNPNDKSFTNPKKAGDILFSLYPGQPEHPGIVHYIIHTYDYPELAIKALPAAQKYASIAPSSAHAQHMPSHIFTRLGLWNECIQSNLLSVANAKCYAGSAGIKGTWDEELHGLDYLVYAYLQKGDNKKAKEQCDYLKSIKEVHPSNFKVAYAFASIPSRYLLENKIWIEAAALKDQRADFPWKKFPWQRAITHFTRLLGFVHQDNIDSANKELNVLTTLYDTLAKQKDSYKARQVEIQIKTGQAWIWFKNKKNAKALKEMTAAANLEDSTEKHPVTPCEVIPARELLGDMLLQMNLPAQALEAYEADLKRHPKRFNGLYGAALSSQKINKKEKALYYFQQLVDSASADSERPELKTAKSFLNKFKKSLLL